MLCMKASRKAFLSSSEAGGKTLILAQNKQTDYKIIFGNDATPAEFHAAEELRSFLGQITGASFQIYQEDEQPLVIRPDRHLTQHCPPKKEWYI